MLLGFDIGGTKCAVVLGKPEDLSKENPVLPVVDKIMMSTDKPAYEMIELLFETAEVLLARNNIQKQEITGIGISCGGPLNARKGIILSPPNLPGWDNVPIVEMAEKRFSTGVILQNDANAGAIAEWKYGAGKGFTNLIFLTFGTGMGAGLILDGKLYSGTTDLAGEVGHLRLAELGPVGFGKAGSFEGFCSGGGLAQLAQVKARQKLQMGQEVSFCKSLHCLPDISAKIVAEAAYLGDPVAIDVYRTCGEYLGKGLSLLIDILNPQLIILGSIFEKARELIEPSMLLALKRETIEDSYHACRIVPAGLADKIGDIAALSLAVLSRAGRKLSI